MAVVTRLNTAAIMSLRGLQDAEDLFALSSQRLSSGLAVSSASDNPATFAISQNFTARLASLEQLESDTQVNRSLVQTADAGLATILGHLTTIRAKAVASSSSTATTADRQANEKQVQSLLTEIRSIAANTTFNGKALLQGSYATGTATLFFQTGPDAGNRISLNIRSVGTTGLGIGSIVVSTQAGALAAITTVDSGKTIATSEAASIGAIDDRLESSSTLNGKLIDAQTSAISAMVDADLSEEVTIQARALLLQQAGASALAQANLFPRNVLAAILPSIS